MSVRFATAACIAGALTLASVACSDDSAGNANPSTSSTGAGSGGSGGGMGGGGSSAGGEGGTVIIPNTACDDVSAQGMDVYGPASGLHLQQLVGVGSRWAAGGFEGFVFFDRDGANADVAPGTLAPNWNVIGGDGSALGVAASTHVALTFRRFSETGAALGGPAGLALQDPVGLAHATHNGRSLVTWGVNTRVLARGVGADGALGAGYDLALSAFSSLLFLRVAARETEFLVAWTGDAQLGLPKTMAVRANFGGALAEPTVIYDTDAAHELVDVVATDAGYVALLTGDTTPVLVKLDAQGEVLATALLEGGRFAHALTSKGSQVGVVTSRDTGEVQARAFDAELAPLGAWQCVGNSYNEAYPPALAADDTGYATLFTALDGSVVLHRLAGLGR